MKHWRNKRLNHQLGGLSKVNRMDILEDYAKLKTWMVKSVEPGSGASQLGYLLCFLIEVLWSWEMLNMVQTAAGNRICCPWNRRSILNYQLHNLTTKCTCNKGRCIERGVPSIDLVISFEAISTPVVQQISQPCACFQLLRNTKLPFSNKIKAKETKTVPVT